MSLIKDSVVASMASKPDYLRPVKYLASLSVCDTRVPCKQTETKQFSLGYIPLPRTKSYKSIEATIHPLGGFRIVL